MIDLYGDAEFGTEHLLELFLVLQDAESSAIRSPESWTLESGSESFSVHRASLIQSIRKLKEKANDAFNGGKTLVCFGD
jgi:hypothetical protein